MEKDKKSEESEVRTCHIVMPNDANPNGVVFGGIIVSWIDMAAAMVAQNHCETEVATIKIGNVVFRTPIQVGDHALLEARLIEVGRTSMEVEVNVFASGPRLKARILATQASLTLVGIDEELKPTEVPRLLI